MSIFTRSWISSGVAVILWACVGLLVWFLQGVKESRVSVASEREEVAAQEANMQRFQLLARDTESGRAALDRVANVDVVSIVDAIDAVGSDAGTKVSIGQALSTDTSQASSAEASLRAVSFVLEADGSFSTLMKMAALLEALPMLSSLEQLHVERTASSGSAGSWHLSARVNIYTTANI